MDGTVLIFCRLANLLSSCFECIHQTDYGLNLPASSRTDPRAESINSLDLLLLLQQFFYITPLQFPFINYFYHFLFFSCSLFIKSLIIWAYFFLFSFLQFPFYSIPFIQFPFIFSFLFLLCIKIHVIWTIF
jgi:hypothetical protein